MNDQERQDIAELTSEVRKLMRKIEEGGLGLSYEQAKEFVFVSIGKMTVAKTIHEIGDLPPEATRALTAYVLKIKAGNTNPNIEKL